MGVIIGVGSVGVCVLGKVGLKRFKLGVGSVPVVLVMLRGVVVFKVVGGWGMN